jgi:hypothetical protein
MTDEVSFEPIRIADLDIHVRKSIEQCPPGLMLRELLQNAIEAEWRDEERGTRRIELRSDPVAGIPKISIYNTGRGMTSDELVRATDLASSIRKTLGLRGRENRGEGAKVASLPWNSNGIFFRSCHDGVVSEVKLLRVSDRYVREMRFAEFDDGSEGYTVWWDVTDQMASKDYDISIDWTEVVLLGNVGNQDTVRFPYGLESGRGEKRGALTEISDRYYDFPHGIEVYASDEYHGRKSMMELRPMARALTRHEGETADGQARLQRTRVRLEDGVELEYVHLPLLSGGNNALGRYELAGDATRIALVWHNEMYDVHARREWQKVAAGFGFPYVHREVSIFIHLPQDYPIHEDAYRLRLVTNDTNEEIQTEDWQIEVRAHMPEWAKDLVEQALAPRQATDMTAVKKELQDRLRKARIQRLEAARTGVHERAGGQDGTGRMGQGQSLEIYVVDPDAPKSTESSGGPPKQQGGWKMKVRAKRSISSAPDIEWLDRPEQVEAENLEDRSGRYVAPTNTLYLNALHPSVADKVAALERHYSSQLEIEQVRPEVIDQTRVDMALHIGSAVVYALAKQGLKTWSNEDWERALSPEALTIAADNTEALLGEIRRKLSSRASFKAAKVV